MLGDSGSSCKDSAGKVVLVATACVTLPDTEIVNGCFGPRSDVLASWVGADALYNMTNPIDRSEVFIRQGYLDVLGREPDASGLAFYLNSLQTCNGAPACLASARVAILRGLLESPENRLQDPALNPASPDYKSAFVTHCYTNLLRRQQDAAGLAFWMNFLNSTGDYNGLISSFINSAEYRVRFGAP